MAGERTVFEIVGGARFFVDLVDRFYDGVVDDPVLRPLYPVDLTDSRRFLAGFLIQYWGGPTTYSQERGHPQLRMRHMPFSIGDEERDAWVRLMIDSLDSDRPDEPVYDALADYFVRTADFLRNTDPLSLRPARSGPEDGPDDAERHR
jgi:hemoglobin